MKQLLEMLTYKRPHGSESELQFIEQFIEPLKHHDNVRAYSTDEVGNIFVHTELHPRSLFTAHVDTVHREKGRQQVLHDTVLNIAYVDGKETNCLGADDTAGVWLMIQMIDAGVPGAYAFFRGEECGGIGSRHAAKSNPGYFEQFDRAVAFDRRGTTSVITFQAGGRCCSDAFAQALSNELNEWGEHFCYTLDDTGVYTDTANLIDLIGECTNVSCGYEGEHGTSETLDLDHCTKLANALTGVDWERLPTVRKAGDYEPMTYGSSWGSSWGNSYGYYNQDTEDVMTMHYSDMVKWVKKAAPEDVAEVISDLIDQLLLCQDRQAEFEMAAGWR